MDSPSEAPTNPAANTAPAAAPLRPAPSVESILRRLFWTLFFRGRALSRRRGREGTVNRGGIWGMLALYLMVGLFMCSLAYRADTLTFAVALHGITLFMVVFQMVTFAGTVLFNKEEAEILLHRPVTPRQLLRAKVTILCAYSAMLAGALNLPGMVTGFWLKDGTGWFPLAHACSTLLMIIFSAGALVVVYQSCLRWFGRERLDGMMTTMQTLLTILMVLASQSFRFLAGARFERLAHAWWAPFMPPVWFASFDSALSAGDFSPGTLAPAFAGVAATFLLAWLAFHHLVAVYGEGLMTLNEAGPGAALAPGRKPRSRWMRRLVKIPPLSWWLRSPVERSAFLLVSAYFHRDREIKLRLYPAMAQLLVMPFIMLFAVPGGFGIMLAGFYLGWLPLMSMQVTEYSEQWRAAEVFQFTPCGRWQPLFHGARKASLVLITLPVLALLAAVVFFFKHGNSQYLLLVPSLIVMPVWSLVPGLADPWLPFSKPFDARRQGSRGFTMMLVVLAVSGILGWMAWFCMAHGLFTLFLIGETAAALIVYAAMSFVIARQDEWEDS